MSRDTRNYEQVWEEVWKENCTNPNGSINLDQIKRELSDYSFLLEQVPSVYSEITGGQLSKTNYYASGIIAAYEQNLNDRFEMYLDEIIEILKEDIEKFGEDSIYCDGIKMAIEEIQDYK